MTLIANPSNGAQIEGFKFRTLQGPIEAPPQSLEPVLALQRKLLYDVHRYSAGDAFLISAFDQQELTKLLDSGATLTLLEQENELLGYSLVTPMTEFTSLYASGSEGSFLCTKPFPIEKTEYLYQIAVAPEHSRKGFGLKLLEHAKANAQSGLLADILVQPIHNSASIRFFSKNGFTECGTLLLASYRDFGKLQSKVYLWTPSENDKL